MKASHILRCFSFFINRKKPVGFHDFYTWIIFNFISEMVKKIQVTCRYTSYVLTKFCKW